jgi:DNA polymerase III subunit epsilon
MGGFLIMDTETDGVFRYDLPSDAPGQPRLAAIAMIEVSDNLEVTKEYFTLVRPEGWTFDDSSAAAVVNGLTHARLMDQGVQIAEPLDRFCGSVTDGRVVVAHNARHDLRAMRGELRRAGRDDLFSITKNICTMRGLTGVCKIPFLNRGGYKWPSLQEACDHFKIPTPGTAHAAEVDAYRCLELFRWMHRIGVVPEPKVHPAKYRPEAASSGSSYAVVE